MPILRLKHLRKTLPAVIFRFPAPSCRKISAFLQNCNIFLDYPTVFQYNKAYVRHGDDRYWFYRCDTCRTLKKLLWIFRENRKPCIAAGKTHPDRTETAASGVFSPDFKTKNAIIIPGRQLTVNLWIYSLLFL